MLLPLTVLKRVRMTSRMETRRSKMVRFVRGKENPAAYPLRKYSVFKLEISTS